MSISLEAHYNSVTGHTLHSTRKKEYQGKVRSIHGYPDYPNVILVEHSDKVSSYDSYICDVEHKGIHLNHLNVWWMQNTKHIIPNHYIYHSKQILLAKRAKRINLEVVVRGYITGSSDTSLWTLYQQGKVKDSYGFELPEGLVKDQKLSEPVVTPTSKGDNGEQYIPLTEEQIVKEGYLNQECWTYLKQKALELYKYGNYIANKKGLILVDTKYEFGFYVNPGLDLDIDPNSNDSYTKEDIILIDELHTGDSSSYWKFDTYQKIFDEDKSPETFDKDHIRRYINETVPEFKSIPIKNRKISEIPEDIKQSLYDAFDIDSDGNDSYTKEDIILIDELHTGDSSSYWKFDTYQKIFDEDKSPETFDKDHIRRYINETVPEFKSIPIKNRKIPEISENIKQSLYDAYSQLYEQLTGQRLESQIEMKRISKRTFMNDYIYNYSPLVIVMASSLNDMTQVDKVNALLRKQNLFYLNYFHSAHKETLTVYNLIHNIDEYYTKRKIVFITVVGLSNALGGVLAANTRFPIINCPYFKDNTDMMMNINSSLQMPSRVPCCTVLRPDNAVLLARNILYI